MVYEVIDFLQKMNEWIRFYYYANCFRSFFWGNRWPQKTISKLTDLYMWQIIKKLFKFNSCNILSELRLNKANGFLVATCKRRRMLKWKWPWYGNIFQKRTLVENCSSSRNNLFLWFSQHFMDKIILQCSWIWETFD